MKEDGLIERLEAIATPLITVPDEKPHDALVRLIDETMLTRRLKIDSRAGQASVEIDVSERRIERIVSAKGVRVPPMLLGVMMPLVGREMADALARFFSECIALCGEPVLKSAEPLENPGDTLVAGLSSDQLAAAMAAGGNSSDDVVTRPAHA